MALLVSEMFSIHGENHDMENVESNARLRYQPEAGRMFDLRDGELLIDRDSEVSRK